MTNATISTIVTTYNNAPYLREALDSVLAQTVPPTEIIVIDDASTDDTPSIVAEYAARDPRIRSERFAENGGATRARNRGIELAAGDYIAFLDADDRWLPTKLALQAAALDDDPHLDVVFGFARQFLSPDLDEAERRRIAIPNPVTPGYVLGGMLIRRAALDAVGNFTVEEGKDFSFLDWYLRARERCMSERLIQDVVVERRIHRTNMSRSLTSSFYIRGVKAALERTRILPALPELVRDMFRTKTVYTPDGEPIEMHSNLDEVSCYLLQHFVKRAHASRIIEVGFAYGISALAIAAASTACLHIEHHIFDPYQTGAWKSIGIENMRRAGFGDRFTFHEEFSEFGLPNLAQTDYQCDFAFIDGNHTFDAVLVDFFYINKMLTVGGIVVFDDEWIPAIRKVTRYVEQYPAYQRLEVPPQLTVDGKPLTIGAHSRLAAFQKTAPDNRNWDWYKEF